jgi:acylaminoacyl-peptidase
MLTKSIHVLHFSPEILSTSNVAVRAPRCSPDNSQVVWLERKAGGPHHGCMRLMGFNMETNKVNFV